MDQFVDYFNDMPSSHRTLLLVGGLSLFFLIEQAAPLFALTYDRTRHTLTNLFFTATTVVVNFAMAFALLWSARYVDEQQIGIIQWLNLPLWAQAVFGLMLMDFLGAWLVHYLEHKIAPLWMFHVIHHTDQHVDTTTGNRHHPGESVIRFVFTLAAVFVVGAPVWLVFLYQTVSLVLTQFSHANIRMPAWLNRVLVWVFCTPDMHRVHHHYRQPYSDSNYGNIFSFWDRIFGTYVAVDNSKLQYGVDTYMDPKETESIGALLKIPFSKYRPPLQYKEEERL